MPLLTKRVQVLFSLSQWEALQRISKEQGRSMGALIREAVETVYGIPSIPENPLEAVKTLADMNLPVADWEQMEKESVYHLRRPSF